jgi:outer membrane protein assembly factor BamB
VWNKPDKADGVDALNAATGELVWFKAFDGDVNGVAFAGCRIVAGSDDGTVRGLDPITGDQAWLQDFRSKVYGQPLPIPGGVMITTGNSGVHKIDAVSGEVIWSAPTGEIRQGAAWDNTSVWVATTGGKMIRFSADGKLQWSGDIPGGWGVWGAPTVVDDGVVAGFVRDTTYGKPGLVGFRLSGALLWEKLNRGTRSNWANVRTSPAFVDGRLYHAEAYSNELVVTELAAATVMKSVALGDCMFPQWSSPVANAEEVIVARHDGGLYAVDRRDQQPRWGIYLGNQQSAGPVANDDLKHPDSRSCSWKPASHSLLATPAVGPDGAIYVGSEEGWLFRVDAE